MSVGASCMDRAACGRTAGLAMEENQVTEMPMATASKTVVVINKLGLHARPAMQFVDLANQFASSIRVHREGCDPITSDGKSVMQMIMLEGVSGTALRIEADGDDAPEAVEKLAALVDGKFGEE